jgi:hypothetical protein
MIRIWIAFFISSFLVSLVTLTRIQVRFAKAHGWGAFRHAKIRTVYWTDISRLERVLVWTGIFAFLLTLVAGAISSFVARAA